MKVEFFVTGIPAPGGSKRAFINKHTGRAAIVDDCKRNGPWRERVAVFAMKAYGGPMLTGPVELSLTFEMPRPKYHYGTGRNADRLKDSAPTWHTVKPDRTKLTRAVEDALTGIIWKDDAQVVSGNIRKRYADGRSGVRVEIQQLVDATP